jgi:hypothetical protein
MDESTRRWAGFSGVAGLVLGIGGGLCERPWPDASVLARFVDENRALIVAQSAFFVLSAVCLLVFVSTLRVVLADAGAAATAALVSGAVGYGLNIIGQAPQLTLTLDEPGVTGPQAAALLDGLGFTLLALANAPTALMYAAICVAVLRSGALPRWLGWLALVPAAASTVLALTIVSPTGVLDPQGWLSYLLYPLAIVWLVAAVATLLRPRAGHRPVPTAVRSGR